MILYTVIKVLMLLLLFKNIRARITSPGTHRKRWHYFFMCYTVVSLLMMILESICQIPLIINIVILMTLYVGNLRHCYISKRLFKTLLYFWLRGANFLLSYKRALCEYIFIALMVVLIKMSSIFIFLRFKAFEMKYHINCLLNCINGSILKKT